MAMTASAAAARSSISSSARRRRTAAAAVTTAPRLSWQRSREAAFRGTRSAASHAEKTPPASASAPSTLSGGGSSPAAVPGGPAAAPALAVGHESSKSARRAPAYARVVPGMKSKGGAGQDGPPSARPLKRGQQAGRLGLQRV